MRLQDVQASTWPGLCWEMIHVHLKDVDFMRWVLKILLGADVYELLFID